MTPGNCLRCNTYSKLDRNSAGRCTDCHNLEYHEYQANRKTQIEEQREKGRQYWAERGIKVGQHVKTNAVSMLLGTSQEVLGIAKVGAVGAYVSSSFQPGYLSPNGWEIAE